MCLCLCVRPSASKLHLSPSPASETSQSFATAPRRTDEPWRIRWRTRFSIKLTYLTWTSSRLSFHSSRRDCQLSTTRFEYCDCICSNPRCSSWRSFPSSYSSICRLPTICGADRSSHACRTGSANRPFRVPSSSARRSRVRTIHHGALSAKMQPYSPSRGTGHTWRTDLCWRKILANPGCLSLLCLTGMEERFVNYIFHTSSQLHQNIYVYFILI